MRHNRTWQIIVGNTPMRVDFRLLGRQRRKLTWMADRTCGPERACLEGVSDFFDEFVDASAEVLGDKAVFGRKQ